MFSSMCALEFSHLYEHFNKVCTSFESSKGEILDLLFNGNAPINRSSYENKDNMTRELDEVTHFKRVHILPWRWSNRHKWFCCKCSDNTYSSYAFDMNQPFWKSSWDRPNAFGIDMAFETCSICGHVRCSDCHETEDYSRS